MISELCAKSQYEQFLRELSAEVDRHALASHLCWSVWSVIQAHVSDIEFDFIEYARLRMGGYKDFKPKVMGKTRSFL